ncbi:MAG: aconitase X swivel domain-containing protein [Dongiaceae bacterium]
MTGDMLRGEVQIAGTAEGPVLKLGEPISFWGGVDPTTGRISDPRHPDHGADIAGTVLVLPGMIGSSSSSYIMLELMAIGRAPAALVLPEPDAILSLGVVVAREMDYGSIPVLLLPRDRQAALATGRPARIHADGRIQLG